MAKTRVPGSEKGIIKSTGVNKTRASFFIQVSDRIDHYKSTWNG